MQSTAVWLARGVDSWFGDRPFEDGGEVTDGRMSVGLLARQGERADLSVRFNARFRMPNIERQSYLFIGRDDPSELVTDKPGALSHQDQPLAPTADDRSFFAGLGRALTDKVDFRLGVGGGIKPYAQARYRDQWRVGAGGDLAEFRQTLFLTVNDRLGATTAISYEHALSSTAALRGLGSATITQVLPEWAWGGLLGLYRTFGDQQLLSLETLVNGQRGSGVGASGFGLQSRWEQPVHGKWLVGGVVIGHFWQRLDAQSERRGAWVLGTSLKMRF